MLNDTIKSLRKKKGMSQAQIAIKLGITQGAVSQWEKGLTQPGADQLLALSKLFGVSVFELKGVDEPETKKEPATAGGLDDRLVEMLVSLSPDQVQRVQDFVAGMKASETT